MPLKSKSLIAITIPINEMTCENCADHVQKTIKIIPGVSRVEVELASNQAKIEYEPNLLDLLDIQHAVIEAGYSTPTFKVVLNIPGMTCISCAAHVEGALLNLPGVLEVTVSLTKACAEVTGIEGVVTMPDMERIIRGAGFQMSS
jgi:Cu+-exporting ATPase